MRALVRVADILSNVSNNLSLHIVQRLRILPSLTQKHARNITIASSKYPIPSGTCSRDLTKGDNPLPEMKRLKPVDWLPFEWNRLPRLNVFEQSGDLVKHVAVDPSWPKVGFEFSEELKNADDTVKKFFTLATSTKEERLEVYKRYLLTKVQRHPMDTTSLEAKIALTTARVRSMFEKLYEDKKNVYNRVRLHKGILTRNKFIKFLHRCDRDRCNFVLKELQLEFQPQMQGLNLEAYCKKWDLRRLTKQYSERLVEEKKKAYHEELKLQQQEFLKEKAEALAWIAEEEKALGIYKEETDALLSQ